MSRDRCVCGRINELASVSVSSWYSVRYDVSALRTNSRCVFVCGVVDPRLLCVQ